MVGYGDAEVKHLWRDLVIGPKEGGFPSFPSADSAPSRAPAESAAFVAIWGVRKPARGAGMVRQAVSLDSL
jgi:hypothetical protein